MASEPNVAAPASGSYGEGAALDRLKSALPASSPGAGPAAGAPVSPAVEPPLPVSMGPEGRPPISGPVPPGIPSAVLGPTAFPGRPVNTPLAGGPEAPGISTPDQARLNLLTELAGNPNVSQETRDWASAVVDVLLGRTE